jgi:hypothetical protein
MAATNTKAAPRFVIDADDSITRGSTALRIYSAQPVAYRGQQTNGYREPKRRVRRVPSVYWHRMLKVDSRAQMFWDLDQTGVGRPS